ncbi:MAG: exopolysaccharide biosynthesis polyprenyl glycosylphosphotransferase, partial [Patescibacteria group bacterium]|nr:exopolysaccharide biosynthesis polyprenyl glycosylphosphotransferase [Patescibacteria group bacterium]
MNIISKIRFWLLLLGDILMLYISLIAALLIRYGVNFYSELIHYHLIPFSIIFIVWIIIFYIAGLYNPIKLRNNREFLKILFFSMAVNAFLGVSFFYAIPSFHITPKTTLFLFIIVFFIIEFLWRRFYNIYSVPGEAFYKIALLGNSQTTQEINDFIKSNPQLGYEIKVWLKEGLKDKEIKRIHQIIIEDDINLIVIPFHLKKDEEGASIFYELLGMGIEVWDLPKIYEEIFQKLPLAEIEESWFLENLSSRIKFYDNLKRSFEFILSLVLFIALLPLEILIALIIKITSQGPIIYKQRRVGELDREFYLYKFRSMTKNAETDGPQWSQKNDQRVTLFGKILRYSHLDELPQLINIMKGEVSFVGPRPERPEFVMELEKKVPYYRIRHLIKPGITGWAQVNYRYGASITDAEEKLRFDLFYLKNRSLFLDLIIILRTLKFFFVNYMAAE